MFDSTKEVEVAIPSPGAMKNVIVKYPEDELIIKRAAALKTIVSNLGRGKTKTEPMNNSEQVDAELLTKIFVSGDELDAFEAQRLVSQLLRVEVIDSKKYGNQFVVTMTIPGGEAVFTMNMPSAKQVSDYRRGVVQVIDNRRTQEIRMNLHASETLYGTMLFEAEGYAADVPVNHKSAVVSECLALMDIEDDDSEVKSFRWFRS